MIVNNGCVFLIGDIKVESLLDFDPNNQTLTCHSTGGPATYVIWRKDSETITEGNYSVLTNASTANYTHTLTVKEGGNYTCTVRSNKIGSSNQSSEPRKLLGAIPSMNAYKVYYYADSSSIIVTKPPRNVMAMQVRDSISIEVRWTASISSNVTGYRIYYNISGGNNMTETTSGERNNVTLKDLPIGNYTVSVIAISDEHLPSAMEKANGGNTLGKPLLVITIMNISYMKLSLLG